MNTALIPGAIGNLLGWSPAVLRSIGNAKPWPEGSRLERPFKWKSTGQGGAFSGLQEFSVADVSTSIKLTYDIAAYEHPVVIPGLEKLLNDASDRQITNLLGYKTEEAKAEIFNGLASLFYGYGDSEFVSLRDYADDGGQTANIGGQSRSTYSALAGTDTASGGPISFTKIRSLKTAVSSGTLLEPTLALMNPTVWDLAESLFTPFLRSNYQAFGFPKITMASRAPVAGSELRGAVGFDALVWDGIPMVKDPKATAQAFYLANEDYFDFYGKQDADLKQVNLGSDKDLVTPYHAAPSKFHGFNWKELEMGQNQYVWIGRVFLFGQWASFDPARQGVLTGVTSA